MTAARLDTEPSLADAVAAIQQRLDPAAVLLFGSAVTGRLGPDSDVDLAVLLGHEPPDAFELAALRVEIEALLGRAVDMVVLDTASPIVAMEVLRCHRVLTQPRPEMLQRFVIRALGAYFDLKRVRRPIEEALLRQATSRD